MVNIFAKFTLDSFIKDKTPDKITDTIVQIRIGSGLDSPTRFRNMCENLKTQVPDTAAESPQQNGVCERNHAVVDRCMKRILEDQPDMPLPKALYWAINAKNALKMWSGFPSYQLVFGRNPNIPYTLTDNPPALEGTATNLSFVKHIHAIHSAR